MNDFTKEELRLLFAGIKLWMEEIYPENQEDRKFRDNLYKKLEEMIDNYCEHEEKETIQTSDVKFVFQNRCKKCRSIV